MSPLLVFFGVASSVLVYAYLLYASKAWFHQDDFIFIDDFSTKLAVSDLLSLDGFGRFLTRNVYWFVGLKVLGRTSEIFYVVNFMTILASCAVLFFLARRTMKPTAALVVSLFYFASPRVIHAYAWISNSQHLIAHFLCFLLLLLLLSGRRTTAIDSKRVTLLLAVFGLALISNAFSLALLPAVLWQMIDRDVRSTAAYRIFASCALVMSAVVFIRSRNSATGAYEVDVSLESLRINADFYWGSTAGFVLWLVGSVSAAVFLAYRSHRVESTMFVCSIAFYVPFAFLTQQRFPQYGVMTTVFLFAGIWMTVMRLVKSRTSSSSVRNVVSVVSILIVSFMSVRGLQEFSRRLETPLGVRALEFVESLRDDLRPVDISISKICFAHEAILDRYGNESGLTPEIWWWLGHGSAFSLFVDASKSYVLSEGEADCDRTYDISSESMVLRVES